MRKVIEMQNFPEVRAWRIGCEAITSALAMTAIGTVAVGWVTNGLAMVGLFFLAAAIPVVLQEWVKPRFLTWVSLRPKYDNHWIDG